MSNLSTLILPSKNQVFYDSNFSGVKLSRLTDRNDGAQCRVSYSYWPTANCISTLLLIDCDNVAMLYTFDAMKMIATKLDTMFPSDPPQIEGLSWSYNDPHLIYGLSGYQSDIRLRCFNVINQSVVWEKNFTKDKVLPTGNAWQMSKARSTDRFFSFGYRPDNTSPYKFACVYDQQADRIYKFDLQADYFKANNDPNTPLSIFDECRLSRNGDCLMIVTGREYYFWHFLTTPPEARTIAQYNVIERAGGHSDIGAQWLVQADVWGSGTIGGNRLIKRNLDRPGQWTEVFDASPPPDWKTTQHLSLTGKDDQFVCCSTESKDQSQSFANEIFLAKLDGTQSIRVCHHRSTCKNPDGSNRYESTPSANLSPDSKFIFFTSDWGTVGGRTDLFVAAVPVGVWAGSVPVPVPIPTPVPIPAPVPSLTFEEKVISEFMGGTDIHNIAVMYNSNTLTIQKIFRAWMIAHKK